jgi:hypothetical protein
MWTESRELVAGYGWGLGSGSRLGWTGNTMEEQGIVWDITFYDLDTDVLRWGLSGMRSGMRKLSRISKRTGRLETGDNKENEIVL